MIAVSQREEPRLREFAQSHADKEIGGKAGTQDIQILLALVRENNV